MSLQVWLPLNGDLVQQGLNNITVTNNGAIVDNSGKIGKCYKFDGSNNRIYTSNLNLDCSKLSLACWFYRDSSSAAEGYIASLNNGSGYADCAIGLDTSNATTLVFVAGGNSSLSKTFTANQWHHAVVTFDGSTITGYLDGEKVGTSTGAPLTKALLTIGARANSTAGAGDAIQYPLKGKLNDFRLYDHCLSQKEVQELAKGLVLHYRLAGPGQENLIKNSQLATSWGANSVCTCNNPTGYSFDGECVKITSGTAGNQNNGYGIFLSTSDISYSAGEKLTFSVDIKGSGEHIALWFLGADGNWWTGANFHTYFTQYDDWTRLSVTGTVPSGTPRMMLGLHVGLSNNTLYAKNMKLERGSVQTPWTPHPSDTLWTTMGYSNNIEYDCSGFENNGTIKYPPSWDVNSPRYTTSYKFDGTAYLTIPNPFPIGTVVREFSHTAWIKWDSTCNTSNGIHSIAYSNNFFRFALGKGSQIWTYGIKCNADGSGESQASILTHGALSSLVHNKWYFIAFTFKDGVCKAYLDGEQVASTTSTLVGLKSNTSEGAIGAYMSNGAERAIGNISDSRFYVTELSEEAIQELYHSAVIIDNTGKTYAYEYFEAN